ncbi:hypothetical protein [Candidatus Electronema sp. JM]|uniref:hypothetical protein n=1 Tax=Candidatus Electronema sp. JM TaxID=3401571 RepID=UPI003AA9259C
MAVLLYENCYEKGAKIFQRRMKTRRNGRGTGKDMNMCNSKFSLKCQQGAAQQPGNASHILPQSKETGEL